MPILPLPVALAAVVSIRAVAHGHFPFPLLWLGVALWWFRPLTPFRHGRSGRAFAKSSMSPSGN